MRWLRIATMVGGLTLVASGGYLASEALSQTGEPTKTVTIDVATGEQGPAGPSGPPGPQGDTGPAGSPGTAGSVSDCPAGSTYSEVVFIQQGKGPTTILTCVKD
jgi:hypothetical protein